ncbi:hypothetical protein JNE51_004428 [Salmonella enterica]|nr:hypothetical protein [Salmonella enterica]
MGSHGGKGRTLEDEARLFQELAKVTSYDAEQGRIFWTIKPRPQTNVGDEAGTVDKDGYRQIRNQGKIVKTHRFIFWLETGTNPVIVDHRSHEKNERGEYDNRFSNLRGATQQQNLMNAGAQRNNTTGFKGVYRKRGKYAASISVNGKTVHLGSHDTPLEAFRAYQEAAERYHGEFANTGDQG